MNDDNTLPNTYFTGFHAKDLLNGYIANASGKDTAQRLEDKPQGIRRTVDQINQAHRDGTIGNIKLSISVMVSGIILAFIVSRMF